MNKHQEEEDCPFCKISEEAIGKLKASKDLKQEDGEPSPWKWYFVFLVIGLIVGALATYQLKDQSTGSVSQKIKTETETKDDSLVPDFTSQDVFGNQVSLSDFRNKKPVLLIFWATWCTYCKQELSDLKEFNQKYKDEIEVIAIDSGETKEVIKDYIRENNIEFLVLLDEQRKIWNNYLVRGTPSHFLISKQGEALIALPGLATIDDLKGLLSEIQP